MTHPGSGAYLHDSSPLARARLLGQPLRRSAVHGPRTVVTEPVDEFDLGDPGQCSGLSFTTYLILDESPSVAGSSGNDPLSRRHAETVRAIDHVAGACRCRNERIAVVPFDQPSRATVHPQRLTRRGIGRLHAGIAHARRGGGSSSLGPALRLVQRWAALSGGSAAVVVFSDFLLTDLDTDQVLGDLAAFPGYVHAVVLGARPPSHLANTDAVAISVIIPSSPAGSVAQAVFGGLMRYRLEVSR